MPDNMKQQHPNPQPSAGTKSPPEARTDALVNVMNRNAFYRDGYRLLVRISLLQVAAMALLAGAVLAMFLSLETRYVYFATTSDGRIINLVPLNDPFRSRADVIAWSAGNAQKIMRFNYQDYRQHMQEVSGNFTTTGWESFTRAMKESRIVEAMEARKLMVSMEIQAAPEIKRAFVADGVYTWDIQFPVVVKYEGKDAPSATNSMLILRIVRVSTLQSPGGIAIEQWLSAEKTR